MTMEQPALMLHRTYPMKRSTVSDTRSSPRTKVSPKPLPSSPYLRTKNIEHFSRVTEKRFLQKKMTKNNTQCPEVEQLYKVNSHQFRKIDNKKQNKSVLTLPHEQAPVPKHCTVSDMTESEYLADNESLKRKAKRTIYSKRSKPKTKVFSQNGYSTCCSSIETIKLGRKGRSNLLPKVKTEEQVTNDLSNVWSAVRNMNKLQFPNSADISEDSDVTTKQTRLNTYNKRRKKLRQNNRVYESYETEEMLCFTVENFPKKSKTLIPSPTSSTDKIAVIKEIDKYCSKPNTIGKKTHTELQKLINKNKRDNIVKPMNKHSVSITKKHVDSSLVKDKGQQNNKNNKENLASNTRDGPDNSGATNVQNKCSFHSSNSQVTGSRKGTIIVHIPSSSNTLSMDDEYIIKPNSNTSIVDKKTKKYEKWKNPNYEKLRGIKTTPKVQKRNSDDNANMKIQNEQKTQKKNNEHLELHKTNEKDAKLSANKYFESDKRDNDYDCQNKCKGSQKRYKSKSKYNVVKSTRSEVKRNRSPTIFEETEDSQAGTESNMITRTIKTFEVNENGRRSVGNYYYSPDCSFKLHYSLSHSSANVKKRTAFYNKEREYNKKYNKQPLKGGNPCFKFQQKLTEKKRRDKNISYNKTDQLFPPKSPTPEEIINNNSKLHIIDNCHKVKENETNITKKSSKRKKKHKTKNTLDVKESKKSFKSQIGDITRKTKETEYNKTGNFDLVSHKNEVNNAKHEQVKTFAYFKNKMANIWSMNGSLNMRNNKENSEKLNSCSKLDNKGEEIPLRNGVKHVDVRTSTSFTMLCCTKNFSDVNENSKDESNYFKATWSKRKWASDFIDHVIMKLRNGIYYTQESRKKLDTADVSVQTRLTIDRQKLERIQKIKIKEKRKTKQNLPNYKGMVQRYNDPFKTLLGWDNVFTKLEVEIPNTNQIEIKDCITNVLFKFDVTMVSDIKIGNVPLIVECCTPCADSNSQTRVFKSKIILVNRVLPASICSLLPMLIKKIMLNHVTDSEGSKQVTSAFSGIHITSVEDETLKIIGEYTDVLKSRTHVVKLLDENDFKYSDYANLLQKPTKLFVTKVNSDLRYWEHKNILSNAKHRSLGNISDAKVTAFPLRSKKEICNYNSGYVQLRNAKSENYHRILMKNGINKLSFCKLFNEFPKFQINYIKSDSHCHVRISLDGEGALGVVTIDMDKNRFFDKGLLTCRNENLTEQAMQTYVSNTCTTLMIYEKNDQQCSTSNLAPAETGLHEILNYCNTKGYGQQTTSNDKVSLDDINTLQDFLSVFLCDKSLFNVIDSATQIKIMNSLNEMKNWITEITPEQAFLVLLLANKKDTLNLMRLRPVILQAIAHKRITNTCELAEEIEVLEKEKLGIDMESERASSSESTTHDTESQNTLLEELYLIAKTTAADFNKPFDVSPDTLLSTLLAKRKTLNPSYLRVMARYVGLGLMKLPKPR